MSENVLDDKKWQPTSEVTTIRRYTNMCIIIIIIIIIIIKHVMNDVQKFLITIKLPKKL